MKLLSPTRCLTIIPADPKDAEASADLFPSILAGHCQPGYYRTAFAEGWINPSTVWQDGQQLGLIGWSRYSDGGLSIDCALAFKPLPDAQVMWDALALLETQQKSAYTRFLTRRRAMAVLAQSHGYQPVAVLLEKR